MNKTINMKTKKKVSTIYNPVKALLSAAYGPRTMSAQLLAVFFTHYYAVTALDRKLRVQGKLSNRIGKLEVGYTHALSVYLKVLLEEVRKAAQTGNAQFLKDLASAFEEPRVAPRGRQAARCWLLMHKLKKAPPQTARQIRESVFKEARTNISERHVYRLCKELGIPVAKGQEGRPRKTATSEVIQRRSSTKPKRYNRDRK
jgi:hypothetical protein